METGSLHYRDDRVEVFKTVVGPLANNVFVIQCRSTGVGILIDAADNGRLLKHMADAHGVQKVLTTHGHGDHIGAVPEMRAHGHHVGIAQPDTDLLREYDFLIADGDVVDVGDLRIEAIATPGHTPGSTCFFVTDTPLLFTGDTLFPGGPGATRIPNSFPIIIESIRTRIFDRFGNDTMVLPGHGDDTTIGRERGQLQTWIDRGW